MKADKSDKGRIPDQVVQVTGWSRDNARRRLAAAARPPKYSYDALRVLQKVWAASDGQCGRYLAVCMVLQLAAPERRGELVDGQDRYNSQVRAELLAMSSATIDRYLRTAKARDQVKGKSGFFEGDTFAHCGPTLKGEVARTVNLTDMHTGWVFTRTVRNNAHTHILGALKADVSEIPCEVTGLDFDNGTEFLNKAVIKWAAEMEIFFTRSRPYKQNDQATRESKNNHPVRKYGFCYRYDTDAERALLNQLWKLVNDRLDYLTRPPNP